MLLLFYSSIDIFFANITNKTFKEKYVLAILNSHLILYWLEYNCKKKGNVFEFYQKPISQIPIQETSKETQDKFCLIVDKILNVTRNEDYLSNSNDLNLVKEYERQIDLMVYKLYELTYSEVKTIDPEFSMSEEEYNQFAI